MISISKRLQTIVNMVPKGSIVADVGSDHGKLMIALFENGIIEHGYAIENKKGPYSRLVKALEQEGLVDKIVPIFNDGLTDLATNVDTVVIAGMGGNAIIDILKQYPKTTSQLTNIIVDAHSCMPKVRHEISQMGFAIADEKMVFEDGIYYEIIKFIKMETATYGDIDLEFGPILKKSKSVEFKQKYKERLTAINKILKNKKIPVSRHDQLTKEKERIEGIL